MSIQDQWKRALLFPHNTLQDAIANLNATAFKIVLVMQENGRFLGTVSDGDIRRGLLRGVGLSDPVSQVLNESPLVAPLELGREVVLQIMRANRVQQLPIVDSSGTVVGLHLLDDLITPNRRDNLMVIMAGGKGTRLHPHTQVCPKPMLPVGGKPMLEHIISHACNEGFSHFVLAIKYLGHMIEEHFGDGSRWGVRIEYLREEQPLGTAGALGLLSPRPDKPFVVTNGDVLTDIRYGELLDFHCRHAAAATMAVRLHEWQHPFGVVHIKGVDIVGFEEKPLSRTHINAGVYVLEPDVLDRMNVGQYCDMPTLFTRAQEAGAKTIVYPMHEPWLDVGRDEDLRRARAAHPPVGTA